MRLSFSSAVLAAAAWLAACSGESPAGPADPLAPPLDLPAQAFHLTIDVRTGRVALVSPAPSSSQAGGLRPSFSLIGSDGVQLGVLGGACAPIPGNPRQKRCSFSIELRNRLGTTDLVTPTAFPRPPHGAQGILVFPWTTSATGGTGGQALPNSEWDHGPVNFFNDFNGCSSGGKSDCYRYELFPTPLYAGEGTGEPRRVGYDIPVGATTVSAYLVVAADLRDNRPFRDVLDGSRELCGNVTSAGVVSLDPIKLQIGPTIRAFCTFENTLGRFDPAQFVVVSATLRLFGDPSGTIEQVDYGTTLDAEDFDLSAARTFGSPFTSDFSPWAERDVTPVVREGHEQGLPRFQFRIRDFEGQLRDIFFEGTFTTHPTFPASKGPQLVVQLKRR